jgi:hypothetical protein
VLFRLVTIEMDAAAIDYEALMRNEDGRTLEQHQQARIQYIDMANQFKNELQEALKLTVEQAKDQTTIEHKRNNLRKFAFGENEEKLKHFSANQLSEIFNTFGILSSPNDQIAVYEKVTSF